MTNPAYEATNNDERDAFEISFPIPKHAIRCGSGYACTDYNAWDAQKFVERWEGWKACALAKTPAPNGMMRLSNELAEMKRSKLVVKLPQRLSPEGYHIDEAYLVPDDGGDYLDRDEVIEAIRAAGGTVEGGE